MAMAVRFLNAAARASAQLPRAAVQPLVRQATTLPVRPPSVRTALTQQAAKKAASRFAPQARRLHVSAPRPSITPMHSESEAAAMANWLFPTPTPAKEMPKPTEAPSSPKKPVGLAQALETVKPAKGIVHRQNLEALELGERIVNWLHPEPAEETLEPVIYEDMGPLPEVDVENITYEITLPKNKSLAMRMASSLGKAFAYVVVLPFRMAYFPVKKTYDLGSYLLTDTSPKFSASDFENAYNLSEELISPKVNVQEMPFPPQI